MRFTVHTDPGDRGVPPHPTSARSPNEIDRFRPLVRALTLPARLSRARATLNEISDPGNLDLATLSVAVRALARL